MTFFNKKRQKGKAKNYESINVNKISTNSEY